MLVDKCIGLLADFKGVNMFFSFDEKLAKKYGLEEAIMIYNFQFWIKKNKANKKHFYNNHYWTYNSKKAFSELFSWWSEAQIKRILNSLINQGILITDNFNKTGYDRTLWYAFAEEKNFLDDEENEKKEDNQSNELNNSIGSKTPMEKINSSNQKDKLIQPIPDINTYQNTDYNNNKEIYKESKLSFDYIYFKNEFNNLVEGTNIPKIAILSDKRIKAINKILNNKQYSINGEVMFKNEDDILNFIKEEVITSDFLCGKNTSWRADIDFILKPSSLIKIIEGNYKNTKFNNNQSYKKEIDYTNIPW